MLFANASCQDGNSSSLPSELVGDALASAAGLKVLLERVLGFRFYS